MIDNYHQTMETFHVPSIVHCIDRPTEYKWVVNYAPSRGSRSFASEADAKQDVLNYIDMRVNTMSKGMFELLRMKRRLQR